MKEYLVSLVGEESGIRFISNPQILHTGFHASSGTIIFIRRFGLFFFFISDNLEQIQLFHLLSVKFLMHPV